MSLVGWSLEQLSLPVKYNKIWVNQISLTISHLYQINLTIPLLYQISLTTFLTQLEIHTLQYTSSSKNICEHRDEFRSDSEATARI